MTPSLPENPAEVGAAMSRLLNATVTGAERVPSFAGNRVYRLTTASGHVFAKIGASNAIATEHAVLQLVAGHHVPVPRVHAADLDGTVTGHPCLVTRAVRGTPLIGTEPAFRRVSEYVSRLHDIRVAGFGTVGITKAGGVRGEHSTWLGALNHRVQTCTDVVEAGLVPRALVDATADALAHPAIAAFQEARLLHGDFHPRHVYSDGVDVTGIIDWGDATAGDPDYDMARVLHSILLRHNLATPVHTAATALPPGEADIDQARLAKLLTYAAVFILWSMHGEYESGAPWPPWWPMQTNALERVLDALESATRGWALHSGEAPNA
jgi:aminoglycoside phosphotransferase (APT) family kinase protein